MRTEKYGDGGGGDDGDDGSDGVGVGGDEVERSEDEDEDEGVEVLKESVTLGLLQGEEGERKVRRR